LGDGFYLCKCEGIKQNGSNDLIGMYVKPGYKIYISEAYCENDKEKCTDIFAYNTSIEYDCSGYKNNGVPIGGVSYSNDTIRYNKSLSLNGTDGAIQVPYNTIA
jgi:hypothetical protein